MSETRSIILAQSAVGPIYEAMLKAARPLHHMFCRRNAVEYRTYDMVMRGFHPWQACYNRILILKELEADGFRGWFMHLDADAVIRHPEFDIRRFLGKRSDYALIACPSAPGVERWNVNDGVFFLNLGHEKGREIVQRWHDAFMTHLSDAMLLSAAEPWRFPDGRPFPGDQHLLQMELLRNEHLSDALLLEDPLLMNHRGAKFIRQFLRAHGDPDQRLDWIRDIAAELAA